MKQVRSGGMDRYLSSELHFGLILLSSMTAYKDERDLIKYLCSFVTDKQLAAGTFIHAAEVVVLKFDYPKADEQLLRYMGECMGFAEEQIDNMLHLVICRETLTFMEANERWID